MSSDNTEPIYLSDLIGRIRWDWQGYVMILTASLLFGFVGPIVQRVFRFAFGPYNRRTQIRNWLQVEPDVVDDYGIEKGWWGHFRMRINLHSGVQLIVRSINREIIRVYAVHEIDPGAIRIIAERGNIRNDLQEIIEAVLANMRGSYSYVDENRNPCPIEEMEAIGIEYRFYRDGFSQQEFMNTIIDINRAVSFVDQRIQQMADNLRDQS